jgi:hypothetical protein
MVHSVSPSIGAPMLAGNLNGSVSGRGSSTGMAPRGSALTRIRSAVGQYPTSRSTELTALVCEPPATSLDDGASSLGAATSIAITPFILAFSEHPTRGLRRQGLEQQCCGERTASKPHLLVTMLPPSQRLRKAEAT